MSAATLSHEMDVEGQTQRKNCNFDVSISTFRTKWTSNVTLSLWKIIKYIPININQHSFFWTCDFYIGTWNFWSSNTFPRISHDVPGASEEHEASGRGRGTGVWNVVFGNLLLGDLQPTYVYLNVCKGMCLRLYQYMFTVFSWYWHGLRHGNFHVVHCSCHFHVVHIHSNTRFRATICCSKHNVHENAKKIYVHSIKTTTCRAIFNTSCLASCD